MKTTKLLLASLTTLNFGLVTLNSSAQTIASGYAHSIAVCNDGSVQAWGLSTNGQVGDGGTLQRITPVKVHGTGDVGFLSGIISVAAGAGSSHTLFLKNDGTVWAAGKNTNAQLGDGTTTQQNTPVQVSGLTGITAIAGGGSHSLALKNDSTVWAWGSNGFGGLGDSTITTRTTPVQVHGPGNVGFLTGIIAVSAGNYFSVALKSDGTVWAWGSNANGQLGDNTVLDKLIPVQVLTGASGCSAYLCNTVAIGAGNSHVLALKNDGTVWAWGGNNLGQLGNNTSNNIPQKTPLQVHGSGDVGFLTGITAVSAGGTYSLALKNDSTVWAWGENYYGQLGDSTTTLTGCYCKSTPVQVRGFNNVGFLTGISAVAAGGYHSIALKSDGTGWGWGWNANGQLGDGTTGTRNTPVQAIGLCPTTPLSIEPFFGTAGTLELISIYPNPSAEGTIQYIITGKAGGEVSVRVYDIIGRKVISRTEMLQGGVVTKKLSTAGLSSGSYLLQVTNGDMEKTQKQFVIK